MQRFVAGVCHMELTLRPQGPWMVRGEIRREGHDIQYPLLNVRGQPVLPASSLKGVLRNTAEHILRSMQPMEHRNPDLPPLADRPFVHTLEELHQLLPDADGVQIGSSEEQRKQLLALLPRSHISDSELAEWTEEQGASLQPTSLYPLLSPASQLFGCTVHAGLVTLDDAVVPAPTMRERSHVAIDRFTGGVGEGPYTEKLNLATTPLKVTLSINNFALWHIALLALVFQEINYGYVSVGAGTRKGQGQMQITPNSIIFQYADAAYSGRKGIISAQAQLAEAPWHMQDVPQAVTTTESDMELLDHLRPLPNTGWRWSGITTLEVGEAEITELFRQSVQRAWRGWLAYTAVEAGDGTAH